MNSTTGLLLIFCGLGIFQSLFFSVYIFTTSRRNSVSIVFSVLLLVLAMRLAKSLTYYFFELDIIFMNIGYAAHAAIGPLTFAYLVSSRKHDLQLHLRDYVHFLPSLTILMLCWYLKESFWIPYGYSVLLYQTLLYLVISWFDFFRFYERKDLPDIHYRWTATLLTVITILALSYFANFILGLTDYIFGPVLYSIMICYVSFIGFRFHLQLFVNRRANSMRSISAEMLRNISRIDELFSKSKLHLNPQLSINEVAEQIGLPGYKVSQIFNDHYQKTFTDFVNSHRVHEARLILSNPEHNHKKIASIAFEVGFHTLSAFNAAFKRHIQVTPSEFRKSVADLSKITD